MTRRRKTNRVHRTLCYLRVSTEEQAISHAGLDAQRAALEAEVTRRGWLAVEYVEDPAQSGKDLDRPGMAYALAELSEGRADVLVAAKVDRLSRSVHDFSGLIDRARHEGWSLITLDIGIDTSTAMGEAMATIASVFGQIERRAIADRTRVALAAKRAVGVHTGRRMETDAAIADRIVTLHDQGQTYRAIADTLNADAVPTTRQGTEWFPSSVRSVYLAAGRQAAEQKVRPA